MAAMAGTVGATRGAGAAGGGAFGPGAGAGASGWPGALPCTTSVPKKLS